MSRKNIKLFFDLPTENTTLDNFGFSQTVSNLTKLSTFLSRYIMKIYSMRNYLFS